jgi:putative ABC transport system permease protein
MGAMDAVLTEIHRILRMFEGGATTTGLLPADVAPLLRGAVLLVLLLAAADVVDLTLERALARRRDMVVRAALGATGARLVRQTLLESTLLALVGAALGLLVALWGVDLFAGLAAPGTAELDATVLGHALALALATGLLFGLSAIQAARRDRCGVKDMS